MKSRRDFIISACKACALIGAAGFISATLEGCKTLKVVAASSDDQNNLLVALTEFAESNQIIVRSRKTDFDILAVKKSETEFIAVLMKCTHESQPLTASGNSLYCASHGSKFDLDGQVLLAPATRNLLKYRTQIIGANLVIYLTNI